MNPSDEKSHPLYQKGNDRPAGPVEGESRAKRPRQPLRNQPLLTYSLMAINGLIYLAGFLAPQLEWDLFLRGAMIPQLVVAEGEVYRLFTAMFLHGSLGHVLLNIYALTIVGRAVEPVFGRLRFSLIYLLGGLTGSAFSLALGGLGSASVGASGAVFAIFAAHAAHLYQNRRLYANARGQLSHMAFILGINLVIGFLPGSRIDNWGHMGGMLGGALLAWRIGPRIALLADPNLNNRVVGALDRNPLRLRLPDLALYIGALIAIVFLAVNLLAA
ncbi:MAG: rhomboid family intramembrane serine protease [Chloroflexi bacterium]|nr:rhomboid family intramembrane serine protease [Chloroflexota bacterium]